MENHLQNEYNSSEINAAASHRRQTGQNNSENVVNNHETSHLFGT